MCPTRWSAAAPAASPDIWKGEPNFLTKANPWERFRIGPGPGSFNTDPAKRKANDGVQFPIEAYDQFVKQIVPRWLSTDDAIIAAYTALVDKVCPCVILFHSQAGAFGFKVAQARPDKVKALVAVEPAVAGDKDKAGALKNIPVMMMFGDYIPQDTRWPSMRKAISTMPMRCARPAAASMSSTSRTSASRAIPTC